MMERKDKLDASELDTVAAALAANQRFDEAIAYQNDAIAKVPGEITERKAQVATIKRMRQRLNSYRKGQDYVLDYSVYNEAKEGKY